VTGTARFAPSPTGLLHLGHAYSAFRVAEQADGGNFLLRMDDLDRSRCKEAFVDAIREDLAWLGCHPNRVTRSSNNSTDQQEAVSRLQGLGVLYPCFCTRSDIQREIERSGSAPQGPEGPIYPGSCRAISRVEATQRQADGASFALRLNVATATQLARTPLQWSEAVDGLKQAAPHLLGDVVVVRKGRVDQPGDIAYHLGVVVDDHVEGVTCVVRGRDLFDSTHIHVLLQSLLGYSTPQYLHHPLVVDEAGKRLAKRDDARAIATYRAGGLSPEDVRRLAYRSLEPPKQLPSCEVDD